MVDSKDARGEMVNESKHNSLNFIDEPSTLLVYRTIKTTGLNKINTHIWSTIITVESNYTPFGNIQESCFI